ncbi:MAG: putative response regulator [Myxococcales bacterium]|nr:putative response regulator [Myxococcales bacterium]
MFKALIVDDDATSSADVRTALADAGCVDIETAGYDQAVQLLDAGAATGAFDVAVLNLVGADLQRLQRLARIVRELPLVVICDERHIEAVLLAGASECVTTPVRARELLGRIRAALRDRAEVRHRVYRERRKSERIVALQREKSNLERGACVDPLTGVANRRHTLALLDSEWRRSARDQAPLGVVMIDLDCYHAFNEQYGHLGGDECLRRVCEAMVHCLRRPSDLLGRYGGEEFIALLPGTDAVGAKIVAERLRVAVEALGIPHAASSCAPVVTITAGFASLRATGDLAMDRLIAVADAALLRAKAQGRNRIEGDAPLVQPSRMSAQRWERFEPVHADPWFADQIPTCLSEAHAGARAIIQALRDDEPRVILRTATALLSTARELGLATLEQLIADLERAASASEVTAAREAADALIQYVTHVQVVYRRSHEPAHPVAS